jgi:hypothetical protein
MPLTYTDAIDTLFGMVQATWQQVNSIVGYAPVIRYAGNEVAAKPPVDQIWARASVQIVDDKQSSLANNNGSRLYHAKGLIYIQIFCPRTDADLTVGRMLAQFVRETFRTESPDGNVWFTNQRILELAPTDENYPITVAANFEYDNKNGQTNIGSVIAQLISRGKHYPVEAIDGIRKTFTFVGLPSDPNLYLIFLNGQEQDGLVQVGQTVTFDNAPKPAGPGFPADSIVGVY